MTKWIAVFLADLVILVVTASQWQAMPPVEQALNLLAIILILGIAAYAICHRYDQKTTRRADYERSRYGRSGH